MTRVESIIKPAHIAPRAHETAAIVEILENPKWKSDAQMAGAIVSAAYKLMAQREWWVVAQQSPPALYGFFATQGAAMKAIESGSLGLVGSVGIFQVSSLFGRAEYIAAEDDALRKDCDVCGHMEGGHNWPRAKVRGCVVAKCGCTDYIRPKRPIPAVEL